MGQPMCFDNAAANYIRAWFVQFRSLGRFRNTLICTVTVCVVTFIGYYHSPARWVGSPLQQYRVPLHQLFHCVLFLAVPLLTLPLLKPANRLGLRLGNWRVWLVDIVVAYAVIATLILIFGRSETFYQHYPLYRPAGRAWQTFAWYQAVHLGYMLGWEFLFRGYMLNGTEREIGRPAAVIVQCLPFAVLHMGKPELESFGSIAAGLYLGILALRANSVLPCVILHFAAAFTMDLYAVALHAG